MKRWMATLLACAVGLVCFAGCAPDKTYQDGHYTAELKEYDNWGYKDFLELTVEDGVVTNIVYDARNADGNLRSQDEKYAQEMQERQATTPQKYTADLINQYMSEKEIGKVDTVAGATTSSQTFIALFKALEDNMRSGKTETVFVENPAA